MIADAGIGIGHGGAISVDPDALRDIATALAAVSAEFGVAREAAAAAHRVVVDTPGLSAQVDTTGLHAIGARIGDLREVCDTTITGICLMADVYEYVELQAEADMLAARDAAAADALRARMEGLAADDPRIPDMASMLVQGWEDHRFDGLQDQYTLGGMLSPFLLTAAFVGANLGNGKVLPGERLTGAADPVRVTPVTTSAPPGAPTSIAESLRRMPRTEGAQIAVERYTMPDGTSKYVTYLKGTQNFWPWSLLGSSEPWDMKSNSELYAGETSSSYQATLDALEAAGAKPGDEVDVVAHSQSGMIAAHLSMESDYDVKVQITAGSPVEPTLDDDQTIVQLRHTDDVVSSLAGGGSPAGTGSPDSFTVSRVGDPVDGGQDVVLSTHHLDRYIDTAEMAQDSGDPRVVALDGFWVGLNEAVEIERTEYHAERE